MQSRLGATLLALTLAAGACGSDDIDAAANAVELEIGGPIGPGTYTTDLLGTQLTMEVDGDWIVPAGDPGGIVVVAAETTTPTSETLLLTRMSSFAGESDLDVEPSGLALSGASTDIDGWLAAGDFTITNESTAMLGDSEARVFDLVVNRDGDRTLPGGCGPTPDDLCVFVGGTSGEALRFYIVRTSEVYRMWYVEQEGPDGALDPILITAIAAEGNEAFLDDAASIVESVRLDEPTPHPVAPIEGPLWEAGVASDVPAGEVTVPALGGLTFTMSEDRFVLQEQNFIGIHASAPTESPIPPTMIVALVSELPTDLGQVATVADALAVFESEPTTTITEIDETIEAFGVTLQGYEVAGSVQNAPTTGFSSARSGGSSNFVFLPGPIATVFLGDAPDGGVYLMSYDAFAEDEVPLAKAIFDEVLPTLELAN